jgi:hypothetical protein
MICVSLSVAWRSNILTGSDWPSIDQWKTALPVTIATVAGEIHFQKTTGSVSWCDFILDFISILKICR